LNVDGSQ